MYPIPPSQNMRFLLLKENKITATNIRRANPRYAFCILVLKMEIPWNLISDNFGITGSNRPSKTDVMIKTNFLAMK